MIRKGCLGLFLLVALIGGLGFGYPWLSAGTNPKQQSVLIPKGASLGTAAAILAEKGVLNSASGFRWRARLLGGGAI